MGHLHTIRDSLSLDSSMFACVSHGLPTDDVVLLWFLVSVDWPHMSTGYNEHSDPVIVLTAPHESAVSVFRQKRAPTRT